MNQIVLVPSTSLWLQFTIKGSEELHLDKLICESEHSTLLGRWHDPSYWSHFPLIKDSACKIKLRLAIQTGRSVFVFKNHATLILVWIADRGGFGGDKGVDHWTVRSHSVKHKVADWVDRSPLWSRPGLSPSRCLSSHHNVSAVSLTGMPQHRDHKTTKHWGKQAKPGNPYPLAQSAAVVFPEHF